MTGQSIDEMRMVMRWKDWIKTDLPIVLEIIEEIMINFDSTKYPKWTYEILERYYKCFEQKTDPNINLKNVWTDIFIEDGRKLEELRVIPDTYEFDRLIKIKKAERQANIWNATEKYKWNIWNVLDL